MPYRAVQPWGPDKGRQANCAEEHATLRLGGHRANPFMIEKIQSGAFLHRKSSVSVTSLRRWDSRSRARSGIDTPEAERLVPSALRYVREQFD